MARLRPARCYRRVKRPYTRKSRFREKSFVKGFPQPKITIFDMGNPKGEFKYKLSLISKDNLQIRHNALEAARVAANKLLSPLGEAYHFKIKVYPHHILRENPLATGAGADRFQQGMARAFGKPIGTAAQVKKNQEIMFVRVNEEHLERAKEALRRAGHKLPCKFTIKVEAS